MDNLAGNVKKVSMVDGEIDNLEKSVECLSVSISRLRERLQVISRGVPPKTQGENPKENVTVPIAHQISVSRIRIQSLTENINEMLDLLEI